MNIGELWVHMGAPARLVAVTLIGMSAFTLAVAIERLIAYRRARTHSARFVRRAETLLEEDRINEAIETARGFGASHLARVLLSALTEFERKRRLGLTLSVESASRAAERSAAVATAELKRGTGGLATVGATAPFVGLLGTVIGIVECFAAMADAGGGGFNVVSRGVSEALVTTALGLLVALPAVWLYNACMQRVERFQIEMSAATSALVNRLVEQPLEPDAGARRGTG